MKNSGRSWILTAGVTMLLLAGCHIETHKNGKGDDVNIGTPFGSMQVKTDDNVNHSSIGLTQYPGSVPFKDKDNDSADVNMSFGGFHLVVKAASYQTSDSRDKVLAFYRNDLKRYGDVIECQGSRSVGKPDSTSQGLTCDENKHVRHGDVETGSGLELRAGSPQHEHIVAVEDKNSGTKIGLVALELPGQIHDHDDKDIE